ncbi:arsenite efflux transporter metallochaperone ArsD [Planococcus sp. ISL-110]|uniref:arsenite efflux transporter metallochaperone ArsD n=1 Tax=Planococcus sp. ISL-110 TaxID=2819167 RepID=UPI001BECBE9D|nr:arsenite efflux transporter metallochaperone ArsD [Planococcus sp. ISL-110]MBT2570766.1 arsenite efflux transporter metallochaperone ArsD [Planococcus sp. ISL-110]
MTKVTIYDPAMCCDTGVCGPVVDPKLTAVAAAVFSLEKKGFDIKRFNLGTDPAAFVENKQVNALLFDKGVEALPVILVDGEVAKMGEYPTVQEFAEWFKVEAAELQAVKQPNNPLNVTISSPGAK